MKKALAIILSVSLVLLVVGALVYTKVIPLPNSSQSADEELFTTMIKDDGTCTPIEPVYPANSSVRFNQVSTKNDHDRKLMWDFLYSRTCSIYATAGLIGTINSESSFSSYEIAYYYEEELNMHDDEYTKAVDNGTYRISGYDNAKESFMHDSKGYGITKWTYYKRKGRLYDYAKAAGASVGDIGVQLNFLWYELNTGEFKSTVLEPLLASTTVRDAATIVVMEFAKPGSRDQQTTKDKRVNGGYYYCQIFSPVTCALE